MKIPESSANVGAYYGNEENGQWQPNGVIIDSGVGGGVVGSGDAGGPRAPLYPLHAPRHVPAGYVMAGAFYPPAAFPAPAPPDDFEDYMWMENEEEFDKQVMQQLEEEALMEQCIEAMLEDEQRERTRAVNGHHCPTTSNGNPLSLEETVSRSTLNPLAAEFVPTFVRRDPPAQAPPQTQAEEKQDTPQEPVPTAEAVSKTEVQTEAPAEPSPQEEKTEVAEVKTEIVEPTTQSTPAEAAAEVSADADKRPKEVRRDAKKDAKKPPAKVDAKPKAKPQPVKSEPKVSAKKEARVARSDTRLDAPDDQTTPELPKPQSQPPVEESAPAGPKPINYAAAARANKPKKPPTAAPPSVPTEKPAAPKLDKKPIDKTDRKDRPKPEKTASKPDKVAPRKNSTK